MEKFIGKYVTGTLFKGSHTGLWNASLFFGISEDSKAFKTKEEALQWLERYGAFQV